MLRKALQQIVKIVVLLAVNIHVNNIVVELVTKTRVVEFVQVVVKGRAEEIATKHVLECVWLHVMVRVQIQMEEL